MSLPVSSAPPVPSSSASPLPLPKDVPWEVHQEIRNLQSEDESTIMKSAASLVMLANLLEAEPHLGSCVGRLASLLVGDYSIHVQRNACAALTAIMNASTRLYQTVAEAPDLVRGILGCLKSNIDDAGLKINVLAAINVLSQQDQGLTLIEEAGIDDVILSLLGSTLDATLEEEAVDTFCALATHENMRPKLLDKFLNAGTSKVSIGRNMLSVFGPEGAVPILVSHLETSSPEVCIRVLLALGMLCGSSVNAQTELAATDGAAGTLVKLMKADDSDIRSVARDLFATLVSNEKVRAVVEEMMRNS